MIQIRTARNPTRAVLTTLPVPTVYRVLQCHRRPLRQHRRRRRRVLQPTLMNELKSGKPMILTWGPPFKGRLQRARRHADRGCKHLVDEPSLNTLDPAQAIGMFAICLASPGDPVEARNHSQTTGTIHHPQSMVGGVKRRLIPVGSKVLATEHVWISRPDRHHDLAILQPVYVACCAARVGSCDGFRMPAPSLSLRHAPRSPGRRSKAAREGNRGELGTPISGRYGDFVCVERAAGVERDRRWR